MNGFSKWPEEASRQATVAIAGEVLRRAGRLSGFTQQDLANLVDGFSKWRKEAACRQATVAIAGEVLRAARLSKFSQQGLANLVNGFSTWPEEAVCHRAIADIARELQGQEFHHDAHKESQQGSRDTLDQAHAEELEQRLRKISNEVAHRQGHPPSGSRMGIRRSASTAFRPRAAEPRMPEITTSPTARYQVMLRCRARPGREVAIGNMILEQTFEFGTRPTVFV
ncbi:hypothetical protein [Bradyrhizobium icense]|uniref:Uncharacterized protein n=1 Tax=Bradyrhizobium icense TaxID=1274631 RepID=A0A1B1UJ30_9BRAD|nr:hypothetical protein [Bradyrhizobium icense]ANW02782.1 hypothetical protein LMTR13_24075 [Bradyrhizobium icense]